MFLAWCAGGWYIYRGNFMAKMKIIELAAMATVSVSPFVAEAGGYVEAGQQHMSMTIQGNSGYAADNSSMEYLSAQADSNALWSDKPNHRYSRTSEYRQRPSESPSTTRVPTTGLSSGDVVKSDSSPLAKVYVGAGVGTSNYVNEKPDMGSMAGQSDLLFSNGSTVDGSLSLDKKSSGYKLYGGYRVTKHLAVEAAYVDLGKYKANASLNGTASFGTANGNIKADVAVRGVSLTGVAKVPIEEEVQIYLKAGAYFWNAKLKADANMSGTATSAFTALGSTYAAGAYNSSSNYSTQENGLSLLVGVGGEVDVAEHVAIRAEWEFYNNVGDKNKTGQADIHLVTGSMLYKF